MRGRLIPPCLVVANAKLRDSLRAADASPFIAHHSLSEPMRTEALDAARQYVDGRPFRIASLISQFQALGPWCLATAIAEDYGDNGHAIYVHIAQRFDVKEITSSAHRSQINEAFVAACRHLGLSLPPYKTRFVDDYVLQAGVSESQLPHMCAAFFQAESLYGIPPVEDTRSLNAWEDRAANLAPSGLSRLRQILWHDESAYHAQVFHSLSKNGVAPSSPFEKRMECAIEEARKSDRVSQRRFTSEPNLLLDDDTIAIAAPEGGTAFNVSFGGRSVLLRRGSTIPLPLPWPDVVDFSPRSGEGEGVSQSIPLWPPRRVALVFDAEHGRLLKVIDREQAGSTVVIDAPEAAFFSRHPFKISDQEAFQAAEGAFVLFSSPDHRARLTSGGINFDIRPSSRPTIELDAERVARNRDGWLYGRPRGVRISVPEGMMPEDGYTVHITHPSLEESRTAEFRKGNSVTIGLEDEPPAFEEMGPLGVELRLGSSDRSFVRARFFVWLGLSELRNGTIFVAPSVPRNFSNEHSRHITVDSSGNVCLDLNDTFRQASLAFEQPNRRVLDFVVPRPGVTASIESANGTERMLELGSEVYVSDVTADTLVIRTDDVTDRLEVRGVREPPPSFGRSGVRRFQMMALGRGGGEGLIRIFRSGNLPLDVVRLERSTSPRQVKMSQNHSELRLQIEAVHEIDAVRIRCRNLSSQQILNLELALKSVPVEEKSQDILQAEYSDSTCRKLALRLDGRRFIEGIWVGEVSARREEGSEWYRLENSRGDRFMLGFQAPAPDLGGLIEEGRHETCFDALTEVLNTCVDESCWPSIERFLLPKWRELGAILSAYPDGKRILLRACGFGAPPGSSPTWVPVFHPVQLAPDLFEAAGSSFRDYSVEDGDALSGPSILNSASRISRVRQAAHAVPVTGMFFMGFENVHEADRDDKVRLSGFRFAQYRAVIEAYSINEFGAWRPGSEMLTARHHEWALSRFVDRMLQASLEGSNANLIRLPRATQVMLKSMSVLGDEFLPAGEGRAEGLSAVEGAPAFFSSLARLSRAKKSSEFWNELEKSCARSRNEVAADVGFLLRLGPELFAFYLILWELVEISKRDR